MTKHYEQRKTANERYLATQDDIKIRAPKGTKDRWRAAAEAEGLSLQKFIIAAVEAAVAAQEDNTMSILIPATLIADVVESIPAPDRKIRRQRGC